jgi:type I restriction enzyme S subunit
MKRQEIQSFGKAFNGKTPSKDEQRSSGHPILKIRDIDEAGQFRGVFESFVDQTFYEKNAKKKLKTGDTIILNAAHNSEYVGSKNAFVPPELNGVIATGEWLIVRVDAANPKYVNQYLKSPSGRKSLKNCVKGIHLYPKDVERITVPLATPDEQIRITYMLGKVEGLIRQRKQHLQQLDDLLKSVFLKLFGDPILNPYGFPVRLLSEFYVNPKNGTKCGPFGSALKKEELVDTGVPVWNMDNISSDGQMVLPFRMWITADKYDDLSAYSVKDGDIIISRAGTVGKMCVARMNGQLGIISTNLIRLRLGADLRPLHFVSLMLYCKGRVGRLKTGADGAFTHMNTGVLDSLEFPYPSVELQDRFGEIAGKVEGIKSRYQQSLTDLESLYGALSQKAFKGELDLSRVPLPDIKPEEDKVMVTEPLHVQAEQDIAINLPDSDNLLDALENSEARKALIGQWLEAYRGQLGNTPISVKSFMATAQTRLAELHPETDFELGVNDYEHIKAWVFEALADGRLLQTRDITGHEESGEPIFGNLIEIKRGAQL